MRQPFLLLLPIACLSGAPAYAMDQKALETQTASALASIDYARAKCPTLSIDEAALSRLLKRAGKSDDTLRKHEDYDDQRNALRSVEGQSGAAMVCFVLPKAHGGTARGLIRAR